MNPDWIAAFLIGLAGSGHCMGMCGGISAMLSLGQQKAPHSIIVLYNAGRIVTYLLFGAIVGATFATIANIGDLNQALAVMRIVAALFVIALALYIGKWWSGLLVIEKAGQRIWRVISPVASSLLPLKSNWHAFPAGLLWGWLPCGLVYTTLTWSALAGSASGGAMIMLSFGLGTLPSMLIAAYSGHYLKALQQNSLFRNLVALSLLMYGMYVLHGAINMLSIS